MPPLELDKVVEKVHKRVPDATVDATDERLPRWKLANRAAWLEYDVKGNLLISGTMGAGSTTSRKHRRDDSASDTAAVVAEFLVAPIKTIE
jgi:hypothetical protein